MEKIKSKKSSTKNQKKKVVKKIQVGGKITINNFKSFKSYLSQTHESGIFDKKFSIIKINKEVFEKDIFFKILPIKFLSICNDLDKNKIETIINNYFGYYQYIPTNLNSTEYKGIIWNCETFFTYINSITNSNYNKKFRLHKTNNNNFYSNLIYSFWDLVVFFLRNISENTTKTIFDNFFKNYYFEEQT